MCINVPQWTIWTIVLLLFDKGGERTFLCTFYIAFFFHRNITCPNYKMLTKVLLRKIINHFRITKLSCSYGNYYTNTRQKYLDVLSITIRVRSSMYAWTIISCRAVSWNNGQQFPSHLTQHSYLNVYLFPIILCDIKRDLWAIGHEQRE